jgi:hypothetical protein
MTERLHFYDRVSFIAGAAEYKDWGKTEQESNGNAGN